MNDGDVVALYAQWLDNPNEALEPTNGVVYVSCKANETVVIPGLPAGTTYQIEEVDMPNGWSFSSASEDSGEISANTTSTAAFTNSYAGKGEALLVAHKALEGGDLEAGQFTFELLDSWGSIIGVASNGSVDDSDIAFDDEGNITDNAWQGTAAVQFDAIEYSLDAVAKDGRATKNSDGSYTYRYTIRERTNRGDSYTYDSHYEYASVTLADNGDGTLSTSVSYDNGGALFTNGMETGELKISKSTVGAPASAEGEEFDFKVEIFDADGNPIDGDYIARRFDGGSHTITRVLHSPNLDDNGNKIADLTSGTYTASLVMDGVESMHVNVDYSNMRGYSWFWKTASDYITTKNPGNPDYIYSLNSGPDHTLLNSSFDVSSNELSMVFYNGYAYPSDPSDPAYNTGYTEFTNYGYFVTVTGTAGYSEQAAANGSIVKVKANEDLVITGLPHGATYKVTEIAKDSWTQESAEGSEGSISANKTSEAKFVNRYVPDEPPTPPVNPSDVTVSVALSANKVLEGAAISEDDGFAFELLDSNGEQLQVKGVDEFGALSDGDGVSAITFDEFEYTGEDAGSTFEYRIREIAGNDERFVYDSHEYTAKVTVSFGENGALEASVVYEGVAEDPDAPEGEDSYKEVELEGAPTFVNACHVQLVFEKYLHGMTGSRYFDFKLAEASVDEDGNVTELEPAGQFPMVVHNEQIENGVGKVVFTIEPDSDGDYYYLAYEDTSALPANIVGDEARYLVHVKVEDGVASQPEYTMLYPDGEGGYDDLGAVAEGEAPAWHNNATEVPKLRMSMRFMAFPMAGAVTPGAATARTYPEAGKTVNGSAAGLAGGDYAFELREEGAGAPVAVATNDAMGRVAFFGESSPNGLAFDAPGTYSYEIREVVPDEPEPGVEYDRTAYRYVVEVTRGESGELEAEESYYGPDGELLDTPPVFNNHVEGIDLQVYKRSRYGGEGLDECTYALWMASDAGDVMIQEATSDDTGLIVFKDVALSPGRRYYFKEVEAPAGHTVDPYRTAYFSLTADGRGVELVEDTAEDGWHSKYDNIDIDRESGKVAQRDS